jgi:hypothetical protein
MKKQQKRATIWGKERGIPVYDTAEQILIKAPLSQVFRFISPKATESQVNVIGTQIVYHYPLTVTYQLEGHDWSVILSEREPWGSDLWGNNRIAEELSEKLDTTVIKVRLNDTVGLLYYSIYERGAMVEYFLGSEDEIEAGEFELALPTKRHIFVAAPADPGFPEDGEYLNFVLFWSSKRKLDERVNASIVSFTEITLEEYDALFVAIKPYYFLGYPKLLKEGKTYHFQTPAFTDMQADGKAITSNPTFVGVDYFFLSLRS